MASHSFVVCVPCLRSLCGQVGVFSPSHRNHYLNVTPNNLLRIYAPDGAGLSSTQLPPLFLVSTTTVRRQTRIAPRRVHSTILLFLYPGVDVGAARWLPQRPPGARVSDAAGV